ncbi:MAG: hypothetical protein ACXWJW_03200 [Xanthobacteraceae bacterium]
MKRSLLALLAGASLIVAASATYAQNANNPAPSYAATATGDVPDTPSKIMDGNNPAPNYKPMASARTAQSRKVHHASAPRATKVRHATHHRAHNPAT